MADWKSMQGVTDRMVLLQIVDKASVSEPGFTRFTVFLFRAALMGIKVLVRSKRLTFSFGSIHRLMLVKGATLCSLDRF